jgi:phosphoglycolate phosphatase-like HAD superfamily hydrolase
MKGNPRDVVFDYDGALNLARRLWALADEVTGAARRRGELALVAATNFAGAYGDQFSSRMSVEATNMTNVTQGLRADAMAVAGMWKAAMEEENRRIYARHVDDLKSHRSVLEQIGDFFTGFHYPSEPDPVPLPQPPGFAPTAEHVHY